MNQTKPKGRVASVIEFIFGGVFLLLGWIAWGAPGPMGEIAITLILLGLMFVCMGLEWRLLIKDYRIYSAILSHDPSGSVSTIAQAAKTSEKTVKDNLRLMIKKGMAIDVALDEQNDRVPTKASVPVAPQPQTVVAPTPVAPQPESVVVSASASAQPEKVAMSCDKHEAANEVAPDTTAACEHCGTTISA